MAFNVDASIIWRFELPLDQDILVIAILVRSKRDLEIFAARTRDRNVREEEFRHSAPTSGFYCSDGEKCAESRVENLSRSIEIATETATPNAAIPSLGSCAHRASNFRSTPLTS